MEERAQDHELEGRVERHVCARAARGIRRRSVQGAAAVECAAPDAAAMAHGRHGPPHGAETRAVARGLGPHAVGEGGHGSDLQK